MGQQRGRQAAPRDDGGAVNIPDMGNMGNMGNMGGSWPDAGEIRCGGARLRLSGNALRLILWIAGHQTRINELATENGQLWLTWKGDAIAGDLRTHL